MKFLVDEMLQRLGRWLRAAGYDTEIENNGRDDYQLLQQALAQHRYLLSCDEALAQQRRASGTVLLLDNTSLEKTVESLAQYISVDWQYRPFTRCMVCNTPLQLAQVHQLSRVPGDTQQQTVYYCSQCNKVYWDGSHVRRMREQLAQWHDRYTKKNYFSTGVLASLPQSDQEPG